MERTRDRPKEVRGTKGMAMNESEGEGQEET